MEGSTTRKACGNDTDPTTTALRLSPLRHTEQSPTTNIIVFYYMDVIKASAIIRDNKRVYRNPWWKMFIWLISRFMNKRHRENWPKAIMASYTIPEVRDILGKSKLNNYRVKSDFVFIDLCIESPVK